jgi:hypothetical protein
MAKENDEARRPLPPYISFRTLTGLIERLKETIVPGQIDSSVLRNYAGGVARQIVAGLKFLGLIEEGGATTANLKALVEAYGTDAWKDKLTQIIFDAYEPVIGKLNLETATAAQLDAAFRNYGADGDVLRKCVAFWVAAVVSAGAQISPHILDRPRAKPDRSKRRADRSRLNDDDPNAAGVSDETAAMSLPPSGTVRFTVPIPEKSAATMLLPPDLTVDDWDMVSTMVKAYITRRNKSGG